MMATVLKEKEYQKFDFCDDKDQFGYPKIPFVVTMTENTAIVGGLGQKITLKRCTIKVATVLTLHSLQTE